MVYPVPYGSRHLMISKPSKTQERKKKSRYRDSGRTTFPRKDIPFGFSADVAKVASALDFISPVFTVGNN